MVYWLLTIYIAGGVVCAILVCRDFIREAIKAKQKLTRLRADSDKYLRFESEENRYQGYLTGMVFIPFLAAPFWPLIAVVLLIQLVWNAFFGGLDRLISRKARGSDQ